MAEAMTRFLFGSRMRVVSAGLRPGEPDGFAYAVMDEIGLDISRHKPKTLDELDNLDFDLVITLSPEAHHKALEFSRDRPMAVEYWPTMDPSIVEGARDQKLEAYRAVRDGLMQRIKKRFNWRPFGTF
jgi:protein-tyrosine-phosphatase